MHRTIGYLSARFVQVRPGEGRKVMLTFLYFFLIITAYYVIKPASRSLVLGELGSRMVPYVDLLCAILMGPIVTLFARLVDRISKPRLVSYSFLAVIGTLVTFWLLLHWPSPWSAGAFYLWVAVFSVLVVTLFWLVANDLYRPREAKRLFGFIGSGGILGGIVGSSVAAVGAQLIGTAHLLLVSSGLLGVCWVVVQQLWKFVPERMVESDERPAPLRRDTFLSDMSGFAKLLLQSRYLLLLVAIVGLGKIVTTLVYYQLNPFIEHSFPDPDARTTFTSLFFGGLNVAAFIVQFFFTSWILRRWGLRVALLVSPAIVLAGTTGLVFLPVFWLAAVTELCDGSLNYSLQQTSKEVLYLPIDRSIRYKIKPFIDMVVFRFGKGIAAVIGIILLDVLHAPVRILSGVTIPFLLALIAVALRLPREYASTIRTVLQARAAARRAPLPSAVLSGADQAGPPAPSAAPAIAGAQGAAGHDEPMPFGSLMDNQPSTHKLALLERLVTSDGSPSALTKELLAALTDYEIGVASLSDVRVEATRLQAVIGDEGSPMAQRRQAIRQLVRLAHDRTADYLLTVVMREGDAMLRREAVQGLVALRLRSVRPAFPVQPIHRQIAHEVATSQRIRGVVAVYRGHHQGPLREDDPVLALLRVLLEESVEQIFRFLMLCYRPEDIHLVYEQMRSSEDRYLRTDAIELLDNLIDPPLRATLFPILDEDRFLSLDDGGVGFGQDPATTHQMLQEAIWDHNCWLSVTTLCAVGRLRLTPMRQELEKVYRQHSVPLVSTAAKVALHMSGLP